MTPPAPKSRTRRPALTDPEWWTSFAVNLFDAKPGSLAKDLAKLLKKDRHSVQDELLSLYRSAMQGCLEEQSLSVSSSPASMKGFDTTIFDPHFPMAHPVFHQLLEHVKDQVASGADHADLRQHLEEDVRTRFGGFFNMLRTTEPQKYQAANQYMDLLMRGYDTLEGQLIDHTNAILYALAYQPLPIDPALTLWKIYVTPRALYWDAETQAKDEAAKAQEQPNLIASLLETLASSTAPIILHGQPGHGKSSTVRMLTHALVTKERQEERSQRTHVLLYEFKQLGRLDEHEIRVLSTRTPFIRDMSFFYGKRTVLILDGMDERQITDGSDTALKDFLRRMFTLASEVNRRNDSQLHLVLTGRSQFVRQVQSAFPTNYHLYAIQDFTPEQIDRWLLKYCGHKRVSPPLTYDDFTAKHLEELVAQPILLTMVALMLVDVKGRQLLDELSQAAVSRGEIYRTIVKWTYLKKWQDQPNRTALPDEAAYVRFLRTIALILFRHGQESIKVSALVGALKQEKELYGLEIIQSKDDEAIEDICRHIGVSFFFKGLEENAFAFIHKSIKDYLTVEALFTLLQEITSRFNPSKPERSCDSLAKDLYFLLGTAGLSPEDHGGFLGDVVAMHSEEAPRLFEPLAVFFKMAITHAYLLRYADGQSDDPIRIEANLLSSVLHFLTGIFHACSPAQQHAISADGYLHFFENVDDLYRFIGLLNAAQLHGFSARSLNLSRFHLGRADLGEADLREADLREANLRGADLRGANLREADLRGADLGRANLGEADLREANLRGADLDTVENPA